MVESRWVMLAHSGHFPASFHPRMWQIVSSSIWWVHNYSGDSCSSSGWSTPQASFTALAELADWDWGPSDTWICVTFTTQSFGMLVAFSVQSFSFWCWQCLQLVLKLGWRDKTAAFWWLLPVQYTIQKSYVCSLSSHLAMWPSGSLKLSSLWRDGGELPPIEVGVKMINRFDNKQKFMPDCAIITFWFA